MFEKDRNLENVVWKRPAEMNESVHFCLDLPNGRTVIVKVNIRMIAQKRHWNCRITEFVGDHERGESHAEGVVMHTGLPDTDLVRFPGLSRSDGAGLRRYVCDIPAAACPCVLKDRYRMQIDDPRCQFAIFFRGRRSVLVLADTSNRIVKRPVLRVALSALHCGATNLVVGRRVCGKIAGRKMNVFQRHTELWIDSVKAQLKIRASERQRMIHRNWNAVLYPFVHTPKVSVFEVNLKGVDNLSDDWKLFCWTDRTAKTNGIVRS